MDQKITDAYKLAMDQWLLLTHHMREGNLFEMQHAGGQLIIDLKCMLANIADVLSE